MATLAVFLYPEKVGIARVKKPGFAPSYSSVQWRLVDNVPQLLDEPVLLTSLIREMVADDEKYDVYLNIWPGAYNAVMFSYDKKGKADVARLRQAELETVFRGELNKMYTLDLKFNKGKAFTDGKCRQVIFSILKERITMMTATMKAQKMKLKRVAPMDVCAAETALKFWAPKGSEISVCMVLDEGCTSVIFLRDGVIHAIRTIPNGFGSVLSTYETVAGVDHDACLEMIRTNGVHVTEGFDMPAIQDDVLRTLNRIAGETVKTLHTTFGDEAVIDRVLLCGNFVCTVGLVEYMNTLLYTECAVANVATIGSNAQNDLVLEEKDFEDLFPVAATTAPGSDLMSEMKKHMADRVQGIALCSVVGVIAAGVMAFTPIQKAQMQKQVDAGQNLLNQPEYTAVRELVEERDELNRYKNNLIEAIEALPHGGTNMADLIQDLHKVTSEYGTVMELAADYGAKTISISFTTLNYDSFVYWQKEVASEGRFSFLQPPTFDGNGLIYTVEANLTAVDFETAEEGEE